MAKKSHAFSSVAVSDLKHDPKNARKHSARNVGTIVDSDGDFNAMGSINGRTKTKKIGKISDLAHDDKNANKGTSRGSEFIRSSLTKYGAARSVVADRHGNLISGNKTVESAVALGLKDVIVVPSDGTKLVVVQRTDIDLNSKIGRGLAISDNRAGELSLEWDADVLGATLDELDLTPEEIGFTADEIGPPSGLAQLIPMNLLPPPPMTWVLIGIPTVEFGSIAEEIERIALLPGVLIETTSNNKN